MTNKGVREVKDLEHGFIFADFFSFVIFFLILRSCVVEVQVSNIFF